MRVIVDKQGHRIDNNHPAVLIVMRELSKQFGMMLVGENLAKALGFPNTRSMSNALDKGSCTAPVSRKRGEAAKANALDIAVYIISLTNQAYR